MPINKDIIATQEYVDVIVDAIQDKKGREIIELNLEKINNPVTDRFIICHGDSNTQVDAVAESVEKKVKDKLGERAWHKEGYENSHWILIDYGNVVVHVFLKPYRDFYKLEDLWADAPVQNHDYEV